MYKLQNAPEKEVFMADMLVKLYDLNFDDPVFDQLKKDGFVIKRAIGPEKEALVKWVGEKFSVHWASECSCAFRTSPACCYVVVKDKEIVGFACYDVTVKDFFGPTGVDEKYRGKGIGKALLLKSLEGLWNLGYAYGVIGGVGPVDFYRKSCGAVLIENSTPGIYANLI